MNYGHGKLIVSGDTSTAKAFVRYIPLSLFVGIVGVCLLAASFSVKLNSSNSDLNRLLEVTTPPIGIMVVILAAAAPFLAVFEAKKCFINVYEDKVCGAYKQIEGNKTVYTPFDLTFDKIESVSANKTNVYLQISGRTIQSKAFNANEIARTISQRLSKKL